MISAGWFHLNLKWSAFGGTESDEKLRGLCFAIGSQQSGLSHGKWVSQSCLIFLFDLVLIWSSPIRNIKYTHAIIFSKGNPSPSIGKFLFYFSEWSWIWTSCGCKRFRSNTDWVEAQFPICPCECHITSHQPSLLSGHQINSETLSRFNFVATRMWRSFKIVDVISHITLMKVFKSSLIFLKKISYS